LERAFFYTMEEKDILAQAVDTVTQQADTITVTIKPKHWLHHKLLALGWLPKTKAYRLTPLRSGNRLRVSKAVLRIPGGLVMADKQTMMKDMLTVLVDHLDTVAYVVAVALHNQRQEPDPAFIEEVKWEFSEDELLAIALLVLSRSGVENFMNTIILVRGLDVISQKEMSPSVPGKPSEA
jgi:hypothetical protein